MPILGVTNSAFFGGVSVEAPDITSVNVQMPALNICAGPIPNPCWYIPVIVLTVKQDGKAVASSEFVQSVPALHVLNACDASVYPFLSDSVKLGRMVGNCYPLVTHADGSVVTGHLSPAKPGETVVIYTTGMVISRSAKLDVPTRPKEKPPIHRNSPSASISIRDTVLVTATGRRSRSTPR